MSSIFKRLFSKKVDCPRCLGKGDVAHLDIIRLKKENIWTPGLCAYCLSTGSVTQKQIKNVAADNSYLNSSISMEERKKLINGDKEMMKKAETFNRIAALYADREKPKS